MRFAFLRLHLCLLACQLRCSQPLLNERLIAFDGIGHRTGIPRVILLRRLQATPGQIHQFAIHNGSDVLQACEYP